MVSINQPQDLISSNQQPPTTTDTILVHAPLHEQYVRRVEMQAFHDKRKDRLYSYRKMSGLVNKFGFAGLTHLNPKQLHACFSRMPDQDGLQMRSVYFRKAAGQDYDVASEGGVSVKSMLQTLALYCSHSSMQDKLDEMWLLINPALDDEVDA